MKNTVVISGFPGVGKSWYFKNTELDVIDSDSSKFSKTEDGNEHPDFPTNYINHIKEEMGKHDIILVSSHEIVRKTMQANKINYCLIYPERGLKDEYIERYKKRGSPQGFLNFLDNNWYSFMDDMEKDPSEDKFCLTSGAFLDSILKTTKEE